MVWQENSGRLEGDFEFADFAEAFGFMTRIALVAQERRHHPDMSISWNRVRVSLTTHDAGNKVTTADREMATAIQALR
jgi:4a-hydroxytetrahydrobiopterin dehydratase